MNDASPSPLVEKNPSSAHERKANAASDPSFRLEGFNRVFLFLISLYSILLGLWAAGDWLFHPKVKVLAFFQTMSGYSGLCLFLSGISLGLGILGNGGRWVAWALRLLAFVIFFAALWNLVQSWIRDTAAPLLHFTRESYMTPATASNFVLLAASIFLISLYRPRAALIAQIFSFLVAFVSLLGLTDYIYGEQLAASGTSFTSMALPTATSVFFLSLGLALSTPKVGLVGLLMRDSLGGRISRRVVPAVLLTQIVFEWFRYRSTGPSIGPSIGEGPVWLQLIAVANPVILLLITSFAVWSLDQMQSARLKAADALRELNQRLEARVAERTTALEQANRHLLAEIGERKTLEREISEIREKLLERIGRVIHDGLSQEITGISLEVKALEKRLRAANSAEADNLSLIGKELAEALRQAKDLARQIYPLELGANGLMASLRELAAQAESRAPIVCVFHCEEPVRLDDRQIETHLFYIAQEGVENALRHSAAKKITVSLSRSGEGVLLSIRDDGKGMSGASG
ncbi:MAG: hypothetical protein JNM63_16870, partial [Spirochaetia bacterium]|nr:hypothetical protein [Spirochaetia bacterium]